ncbi:hypothetical protein CJ483_08975 [Bacillus sp. PK3_68]|nr:hypothetical protein CJ483_08975 [Bacillus sp. PK3_68]
MHITIPFSTILIVDDANFDLLEHYNVKNYFMHGQKVKLAEKSVNNNKYVETWHYHSLKNFFSSFLPATFLPKNVWDFQKLLKKNLSLFVSSCIIKWIERNRRVYSL